MSLPRYAEYKDSGVEWLGEVPGHWDVKRLKQACHVFPSNVDKKSHDGETSVNLCNYTDVYYNETITADMEFMAATASDDQIAKFTLRAGDTIITKDSETADDIAIGAYVPADLPGVVCGYHLSMIRPLADTVGAFVKRLFDSTYVRSCVAVRANGLTRVGLGQYEIDNLQLPFPPPAEQQTIAAFLDRETGKIDALIAEQRHLVELLAEKRQAVISHAVTKGLNPSARMKDSGIAWLGVVPKHWEVCAVRRVIERIEQGWSPECESRPAEPNEWGVLKSGCVNRGIFVEDENKALPVKLEPISEYEVQNGDVLMSRASGSPDLIGSVAFVEKVRPRLMLSDKIFRIKLNDRFAPRFFVSLFHSSLLRAQIVQSISGAEGLANNLPQSSMKRFFVTFPPIEEQQTIATFLDTETAKFDTLTAEANRAIALLQERRSALISAAVTGKIDVRRH
jgi:type I restriction enzyme, S subunit